MMKSLAVIALSLVLASCGAEDLSSVSTSLIIPRQLAAQLSTVTIFLVQVDTLKRPDCTTLLGDPTRIQSANVVRRAVVEFNASGVTQKVIDDIPDRGTVWEFYTEGHNVSQTLVGHGCAGVFSISKGEELPVTISMCELAENPCPNLP